MIEISPDNRTLIIVDIGKKNYKKLYFKFRRILPYNKPHKENPYWKL